MIRNTFNSYFKSLLKTTPLQFYSSTISYPNLSMRQCHDKIIIVAKSKASVARVNQIIDKLFAYDSLGLNKEEYRNKCFSVDGIVIAGITYRFNAVINSPFFWVYVSIKINPTKKIKPELIESKLYDPIMEGKPFKTDVCNFLQDVAIKGNINFMAQYSFNMITDTYDVVCRTMELLGFKKYTCSFEQFEVNIAFNSIDMNLDYSRITIILRYLFGEPKLVGKQEFNFEDFEISNQLCLKVYQKVKPSVDGSVPGMIRAELVLRNVKIKDFSHLYSLVYDVQNELDAYSGYIRDVLINFEKNDAKSCELFVNYSELLENPVPKIAIPSHLNGCFTQIPAKSLCKRNVLLPELLAKKLRGGI